MDDKALKRLVEDELDFEPKIEAAAIAVTVQDGIVHLTGHVRTLAEACAAETAVRRLKGVRGLVQDLQVQPIAQTECDEAIACRVANLLDWDVTTPEGAIKVQVQDGYVTLTGEVDWAYQKHQPEASIRRLAGVKGLNNQVLVKPRADAGDIKRRIEAALDRQAELKAQGVRILVEDGRVRLDGKVRSWRDRDAVEQAAWKTPGVIAVDDHVTLEA